MSSAFVELLRKANLDFIVTQKPLKLGSHTDDILFASLIDPKSKTLQLVACSQNSDPTTLWSTSLDERTFQLNARLLDLVELGETMNFLAERLTQSDFTLDKSNNKSQLSITFVHSKTKQSITLQLDECLDEQNKTSLLTRILFHVHKRNEQLSNEVKTQQAQIRDLSIKRTVESSRSSDSTREKTNTMKSKDRTQMSLINPSTKRRKAATGVNYDDDDSD